MDVAFVWLLSCSLMLVLQQEASSFSLADATVQEESTMAQEKEGPTAQQKEGLTAQEKEVPVAKLARTAHHREKRCSCENQKDKECIFFCHIGIVWVNTPSHLVPYGFGSVRLKRELSRCRCTNTHDSQCVSFCTGQNGGDILAQRMVDKRQKGFKLAFWEKRHRHALNRQT